MSSFIQTFAFCFYHFYIFFIFMNFPNYFPFMQIGYPCFVNIMPYQYQSMPINPFFESPSLEEPLNLVKQQEKQLNINEVNLRSVQQELKILHFQQPQHKKVHWTLEEDAILQRLIQIQKTQWKDIPKHFSGRTQNMCYSRYRRISLATKDRAWNIEDQEELTDYVSRYGQKWKIISEKMPKFTPKQIRQRYLNYLRPNINKQNFSYEQDLKICQLVLTIGKHWRKMQESFINRPQGLIKGRYYGKLKQIIQNAAKKSH